MMRSLVLLVSALALGSCDAGVSIDGPAEHCTETGVQCVLPDGPLGVCERSRCEAGATPPCFTCTPQH